jgi:hypothetical protein
MPRLEDRRGPPGQHRLGLAPLERGLEQRAPRGRQAVEQGIRLGAGQAGRGSGSGSRSRGGRNQPAGRRAEEPSRGLGAGRPAALLRTDSVMNVEHSAHVPGRVAELGHLPVQQQHPDRGSGVVGGPARCST